MGETLTALEDHFWTVICMLVVVGWVLAAIIRAIRGDEKDGWL